MEGTEQFITFKHAARQYGLSEAALRDRAQRGTIATRKYGYARLIVREDLERELRRSPAR